jgi:hypothetical protein
MNRQEAAAVLGTGIVDQLVLESGDLGIFLIADLQAVADYTAERIDHLATLVGEPGYDLALLAERDNIAIKAGIVSVENADDLDRRILAVLRGGLSIAAMGIRMVAGLPPVL